MRPAVFLDRDGTLNEEVDYLHKPEDLVLIPGAAAAVARLNAAGIPVVVVTNQSGIGRGYYGWKDFSSVMSRMGTLLAMEDARLDAVYVSPHHGKGQGDYAVEDHPDRKPNPGMLQRAAEEHGLDLARSWMVGDKDIDVLAGHRAGCRACLVRTGYGAGHAPGEADHVADSLVHAVDHILAGWPWPSR
ncbi:MAG TPA: HAD family hydrolase [Holophagaceae bacterium]|nr:HAD family hydrolase [Holophagaceae bacterium]